MLIQVLLERPETAGTILRSTPVWVWGLLAALLALGLTQLRDRRASLVRVSLLPIGMTAFSAFGAVSDFRASPQLPQLLAVWLVVACSVAALLARGATRAVYDPSTRSYAMPGSVIPLLLILAVFTVKYAVGVELAMAPQLARESSYALAITALYGAVSGLFIGRACRLWRLALRARPAVAA